MSIDTAILNGTSEVVTAPYLPADPSDARLVPHLAARVHLHHRLSEGIYA